MTLSSSNASDESRARLYRRWLLLGLAVTLTLINVGLFIMNQDTPVPAMWGAGGGRRNQPADWLILLLQGLVMPLAAVWLGTLIVTYRSRHLIGWLLIGLGMLLEISSVVNELTVFSNFTLATPPPWSGFVALLMNVIWVYGYILEVGIVAVFPDGSFLSARWRWLVTLPLAVFALSITVVGLFETPLSSAYQVAHPFLSQSYPALEIVATIGILCMPISMVAALGAMLARFRRAGAIERQQIKWLLVSIILMALFIVVGLALAFGPSLNIVGELMVNSALLFLILGFGVAILRYRLYDIDIIINRTLVYGTLTAALALVYVGCVVLLRAVLAPLTGSSELAIVASTLAIAALFTPLRRRIQNTIDKRFYRRKYDAANVLAAFGRTVRDETDLERLTAEMLRVAETTVQPAFVGLWLRTEMPPRPTGAPMEGRR